VDVFLDAGALIDLARADAYFTLDPNVNYVTTQFVINELGAGFVLDEFNNFGNVQTLPIGIDLTQDTRLTRQLGVSFNPDGSISQLGDASLRWLELDQSLISNGQLAVWTNDRGLLDFTRSIDGGAAIPTSLAHFSDAFFDGRITAAQYSDALNAINFNAYPAGLNTPLFTADDARAFEGLDANDFAQIDTLGITGPEFVRVGAALSALRQVGALGDVLGAAVTISQITDAIRNDDPVLAEQLAGGAFGEVLLGTAGGAAGGALAVGAYAAIFTPEPITSLGGALVVGLIWLSGALVGGATAGLAGNVFGQYLTIQLQNVVAGGGSITTEVVAQIFNDFTTQEGIDTSNLIIITNENGELEVGNRDECFLAGTEVSLFDGRKIAIENIKEGDKVLSYTSKGDLVPGKVTKLFRNDVRCVLDVHGLMVTPGHVTYCADGQFDDQHVPIIDIILSDSALMRENGERIRVATNEIVGSKLDQFVILSCAVDIDALRECKFTMSRVRLGTKIINAHGDVTSLWDMLSLNGFSYDAETELVISADGTKAPMKFLGTPPKPEDYILAKSGLTLADIYNAGEWREDQGAPGAVFGTYMPATQN